jgi:hypothetical protein
MCASIIGTWSFSVVAVNEIVSCLEHGDNILHAMEKGINGLSVFSNLLKSSLQIKLYKFYIFQLYLSYRVCQLPHINVIMLCCFGI